jgi:hypothetical protein
MSAIKKTSYSLVSGHILTNRSRAIRPILPSIGGRIRRPPVSILRACLPVKKAMRIWNGWKKKSRGVPPDVFNMLCRIRRGLMSQ